MNALQAAALSALKKLLRSLAATVILAAAAALPQIKDVFTQAAQNGDMFEKLVYGAVLSGIVALIAFVDRYVSHNAQQKS